MILNAILVLFLLRNCQLCDTLTYPVALFSTGESQYFQRTKSFHPLGTPIWLIEIWLTHGKDAKTSGKRCKFPTFNSANRYWIKVS